MLKPRTFVFFFFLLFSLPLSSLSQSDSVYDSFLKCFSEETKSPESKLTDIVYSQSNPSFFSVLRAYIRNWRFKTSSTPKPTIIITPRSESHVSAAVICSKTFDFVFKIRNGGHYYYDGFSYISDKPFFILDLSNLRDISVDIDSNSAWISAGAILGEVHYRIWEKSKIHGFLTVDVDGHLSGEFYGNMFRKSGLSVDNLIDAKIVDVDGRILDRKAMGEDIFWAIFFGCGGGGGRYGVVVGYKVKLVPVPSIVTVFRVEQQYMDSGALDLVHKWQSIGPKTDPNLFVRVLIQPSTRNNLKTVRATVVALFLGRANEVVSLLSKEVPELGLKEENCTEMNWFQSTLWWDNNVNATQIDPKLFLDPSFRNRTSDYVEMEMYRGSVSGKSLFISEEIPEVPSLPSKA